MKIVLTGMMLWAMVIALPACKKDDAGDVPIQRVRLQFDNRAGNNPLVLNTPFFTPLGESFTATQFKYHVTHVTLVYNNGDTLILPDYTLLIDESKAESQVVDLIVPANSRFKEIRFLLGVDSARNVGGVQSGALDPANGMFWTWNTGYIMAKLEGRSPISPAPLQAVTYHIGGFRQAESVLKRISLPFPASILVTPEQGYQVTVHADAAKWFKGVHDISITTTSVVMDPGALAQKVADNYARMFTVFEVVPL
jgi:hypothetical protein